MAAALALPAPSSAVTVGATAPVLGSPLPPATTRSPAGQTRYCPDLPSSPSKARSQA